MDEIEWMKHTKKAIIFICKIIVIFILFFELVGILGFLINDNDISGTINLMLLFLVIGIIIISLLLIFLFILNILYRIIYSGRKLFIWEKEYIRDFPKDCPPAIASLLYDLKIDIYKDYTATILELYLKKYINIVKNDKKYEFKILKESNEISNLNEHQQYVLSCVTDKNKFDEIEFKNLIIKDAQSNNLIDNTKNVNLYKLMIIILTPIILLISYYINEFLFYTLLTIVLTLLVTLSILHDSLKTEKITLNVDTNYKRTKKGKEKALELSSLKQFIHDYTLIKDKPIDYIEVLEEYIPYALSLNEAYQIEDFIKNNDIYRYLIYKQNG